MRDMTACHNQPHVVPPMRPVFYDDKSGQGYIPQHHNSISSWPQEHQDSATRAPRWGRKPKNESSAMPLKISAPSNFRVLQSSRYEEIHNFVDIKSTSSSRSNSRSTSPSPPPPPPPTPTPTPSIHYQPLDLRIHQSDNRLSDLPSFKAFQLNEITQHNTVSVPRALNYSAGIQQPVGSERLSSLGHPGPRSLEERDQVTSRLIPHFSTRIPVDLIQTAEVKSPPSSRPNSWLQRLSLSTLFSSKTKNRQSCEKVPQTSSAPRSLHTTSANSSPRISKRTSSSANSQTMSSQASLLAQPSVSLPDNRISDPSSPLSPSRRVTQWMFPPQNSPMQVSRPKDNFKWEQRHSLGAASAPSADAVTGARTRNTVWPSGNPPRAVSSFFISPTMEENPAASVHRRTIYVNQQRGHPVGRYQSYETPKRPRSSASGVGIAF